MSAVPRTTAQKVWLVFGILLATVFAIIGLLMLFVVVLIFTGSFPVMGNK